MCTTGPGSCLGGLADLSATFETLWVVGSLGTRAMTRADRDRRRRHDRPWLAGDLATKHSCPPDCQAAFAIPSPSPFPRPVNHLPNHLLYHPTFPCYPFVHRPFCENGAVSSTFLVTIYQTTSHAPYFVLTTPISTRLSTSSSDASSTTPHATHHSHITPITPPCFYGLSSSRLA